MSTPTRSDCRTFSEFQKRHVVLSNWQYVLLGVAMLAIGLVSGFIIGYHVG